MSISVGDKIVFRSHSDYPHNVTFDEDEDEVPASVDAGKNPDHHERGRSTESLNAQDETYTVVLNVAGNYGFYCAPHQEPAWSVMSTLISLLCC